MIMEKTMKKYAKRFLFIFILMMLPAIQNCGSETSSNSSLMITDKLLTQGWDHIKVGNYTNARGSLKDALRENTTAAQLVEINNALGWAYAKDNKIMDSIQYFEKAYMQSAEAKVGLAGALIFRHESPADFVRAAELLASLPPEKFAPVHSGLNLTPAKVHVLTAVAFALANDMEQANHYMAKAAALDSLIVGSDIDRIDTAFCMLGWKQ